MQIHKLYFGFEYLEYCSCELWCIRNSFKIIKLQIDVEILIYDFRAGSPAVQPKGSHCGPSNPMKGRTRYVYMYIRIPGKIIQWKPQQQIFDACFISLG